MKNKEIVLLIISVVVISLFFYMNFSLCNKDYPSYNTSNGNTITKSISISYGDKKIKNAPKFNSSVNNSEYYNDDFNSMPSDESYHNVSINDISTNNSLNNNYSYKESSYSNNNSNNNSNINNILITPISSHNSSKNINSEYSQNLSSVSTTSSPEIDAVNYANGPLKCEPVKCGHNVWIDGYWKYNHDGHGHHKEWICGYWKWVDEDCNPAVPVGDGTLILISLLIIYVPIKLLSLKKLKKNKI